MPTMNISTLQHYSNCQILGQIFYGKNTPSAHYQKKKSKKMQPYLYFKISKDKLQMLALIHSYRTT